MQGTFINVYDLPAIDWANRARMFNDNNRSNDCVAQFAYGTLINFDSLSSPRRSNYAQETGCDSGEEERGGRGWISGLINLLTNESVLYVREKFARRICTHLYTFVYTCLCLDSIAIWEKFKNCSERRSIEISLINSLELARWKE